MSFPFSFQILCAYKKNVRFPDKLMEANFGLKKRQITLSEINTRLCPALLGFLTQGGSSIGNYNHRPPDTFFNKKLRNFVLVESFKRLNHHILMRDARDTGGRYLLKLSILVIGQPNGDRMFLLPCGAPLDWFCLSFNNPSIHVRPFSHNLILP